MSAMILAPLDSHHSDSIYISSDEYSRLFYQPTDFKVTSSKEDNLLGSEDEFKAIERADIKSGAILCAILSKYVLGGMTKGTLWTIAVREGIFLAVVKRMKEIVEHWDGPFEVYENK